MDIHDYPKRLHKGIRELVDRLCTTPETAYRMMLMTALLMDLNPEDDRVIELILLDCNVEVEL